MAASCCRPTCAGLRSRLAGRRRRRGRADPRTTTEDQATMTDGLGVLRILSRTVQLYDPA
ncbi:hypothetical protein FM114_05575 [Luteococcus japonicus LSP_Lj1]|uniref:Uncharacterized protein n=1 Tax=Luteococcus japonicus LSP_Lj1 TaxID=1255658 RepID=A0A1R4J541_9ACTN|nr:hypothetical protein FM114_05575 [Luteococcus japonicus LSP_Lj1]